MRHRHSPAPGTPQTSTKALMVAVVVAAAGAGVDYFTNADRFSLSGLLTTVLVATGAAVTAWATPNDPK